MATPRHVTIVEFNADLGRAAVDDQIDAAVEIGPHMRRRRGRHVAGAVCRRRDDWPPEGAQNVLCDGMPGNAHGNAIETGRCQAGNGAAGSFGQHKRERSWPKGLGERRGIPIEARERLRRLGIANVRDERIEGRAALGFVKPRHGLAIGCVGAEAVNGLGGKSDEAATV